MTIVDRLTHKKWYTTSVEEANNIIDNLIGHRFYEVQLTGE